MDIMDRIYEKAASNPQRVAFSEVEEEKILLACHECVKKGLITPVLVGAKRNIEEKAKLYGISLDGMEFFDSTDEKKTAEVIDEYRKKNDILSEKALKRRADSDSMFMAMYLLAINRVDACFAGMAHTTGEVIEASLLIIGLKEGITTPSSVGIFKIPGYNGSEGELLAFGDSAVCVNPESEELASKAISACDTVKSLLGWNPRCAMLSYSTDGSGESSLVDKVRKAVEIAREIRPEYAIDGEFQLDAAINQMVADKKVKHESKVAGNANIIIWPDINVGNIGVKLVQYFAKADAYGPLLQGFNKIVCDCSRGAPVSELVGNIAMAAVRAQEEKRG